MMNGMNMDRSMSWMMGGMGLFTLLIVIFLIAGIVFFIRRAR